MHANELSERRMETVNANELRYYVTSQELWCTTIGVTHFIMGK